MLYEMIARIMRTLVVKTPVFIMAVVMAVILFLPS
jgi:hypothetical protein